VTSTQRMMISTLPLSALTEWQRGFLDQLAAKADDATLTEWQGSQLKCVWRDVFGDALPANPQGREG
jgi:hypothetical protein